MQPTVPIAPPVAPGRARRSDARFLIVWALLVGGLVVAGVASRFLSRPQWLGLLVALYYGPFKIAALIGLTAEERRRLTWGRLLAFWIWLGQQPRQFLPSYSPPPNQPRPTWGGFLLNLAAGAVLLHVAPRLFPPGTPLLIRAWTGLVGVALLRLFATCDLWVLVFRRIGFPVDNAWDNPPAATSLRDFWGRRWNRIMSGMMRDLLFLPLARRIGVIAAGAAVFVYSGVLHEFVSVLAGGGYGGPTLYFLIQGAGFLFEGTRFARRFLVGSALIGRCWTALVVLAPLPLVVPPAFLYEVIVPFLREMQVPGLIDPA
jgi:hypothetical protein